MEVRNTFTLWDWGEWYQEAERRAKFACELSGKSWDAHLTTESALRQGAVESYEGCSCAGGT